MKEIEIDHLLMEFGNISHQMVRRKIKQMKGSKSLREVPRVPACHHSLGHQYQLGPRDASQAHQSSENRREAHKFPSSLLS